MSGVGEQRRLRDGRLCIQGANPTSNVRDNVCADSLDSELATVTGDPSTGYVATFTLGVAA